MRIGVKRRERLIADILGAQHDLVALGKKHRLRPEVLASWVSMPGNHQVLRGLCLLADLQTQVLLSRYRLLAATRLIKLATDESAEGSADVARRACVDLLRLDLKRVDEGETLELTLEGSRAVATSAGELEELHEKVYGSLPAPAGDGVPAEQAGE
ncbi:MAG: hypothetical protein IT443_01700 [Phycisphaeraceae bacterium]|nr:hypothetical protein [Phycisphaeraceae bacterium]